MNFTSEQHRRIEAAVAECMGIQPCYTWQQTYGGWGMAMTGEAIWIKKESADCGHADCYPIGYPAPYTTNPAANAALWDWLISHGWYVALKYSNSDSVQVHQAAVFRFKPTVVYSEDERDNRYLSLCMAFLRAMGRDIDALLGEK